MNISESSSANRVYIRTFALLLVAICLPGSAQAQWTTSGSNVTTSSNVGIGTTGPGAKLEVANGPTNQDQFLRFDISGAHGNITSNYGLRFQTGGFGDDLSHGYISFETIGNPFSALYTPVERMRITKDGNVGIGTTSPSARLEIGSTTSQYDGIMLSKGGDAENAWAVFRQGMLGYRLGILGSTLASGNQYKLGLFGSISSPTATAPGTLIQTWDYASGSIGIGTSSPGSLFGEKLTINGAMNILAGNNLFFSNPGNTNAAMIKASSTSGGTAADLQMLGGSGNGIFVQGNGNVGIGTTTPDPAHKLEVVGAIHATQGITGTTINATYQDVAEWVPSSQILTAATVVILDPEQSTRVIASTSAYDTRVAGVISARPGLTLGEAGPDKTLVATTGRVKVRVDATQAPIRMGDLLVTSDIPGVAMRSEPLDLGGTKIHRPGTIIGKALEPLKKGTGEILVLLSLQ